jgi:hypothetical protein
MICRSYSNAYMLVYVKKSAIGGRLLNQLSKLFTITIGLATYYYSDALAPVAEEDIPNHLKHRFENEKKRDVQRKKEKEEASYYCEIAVSQFFLIASIVMIKAYSAVVSVGHR